MVSVKYMMIMILERIELTYAWCYYRSGILGSLSAALLKVKPSLGHRTNVRIEINMEQAEIKSDMGFRSPVA